MSLNELDFRGLTAPLPEGVPFGTDQGAMVSGVVLGLDPASRIVQVSVFDSDPVWVPAVADIYTAGGVVRLLRSPLDGGRISMCLGPATPGIRRVTGIVRAVNTAAGTLTVATLGGEYQLPMVAATYSVGATVHVLRDPGQLGLPDMVLGPTGAFSGSDDSQPGGGSSNAGKTVTKEAVILPTWSGAWRTGFGWDRWNTNRYGGRSSLWQGNAYGSGAMTGLAVYGEQVKNLGALAITRMQVSVIRADASDNSGKVAGLISSPQGDPAPAGGPVGDGAGFASTPLAPNQGVQVDLPASAFEAWRTGTYRGIASSGGDYMAISGTPDRDPIHADGMALVVTYEVTQ